MISTLDQLFAAIPGHWDQVIATIILLAAGIAVSQIWARYLARSEISAGKRRLHLVWVRNVIWFLVSLIIVAIWASTIAGFALSLAAVAAAVLIVSKELLMCVLGYFYITLVRAFKIGDLIELNQLYGRVIDIDMFATTIAELGYAGQISGKTAEFPNSLLLTTPLKNTSPTGKYVLHLLRMPIPEGTAKDIDWVESAALSVADAATREWRDQAETHFREIADESFITFSSVGNRVIWDFSDPKQLMLVVRFACPSELRLKVEQAVFRGIWHALKSE
ncbi:MAG: mechanosensitive ion channel domain-containing protein [Thiobacillus sp.]|nr:MAG: mechanosensitive ion channel protein MscS [Thiobacillus sp. SCN 63-374]OZA29378.1 MAG: mechanosensitive ion channel protein MscS [Hydrogenophilales bacterium 17-64-11]